MAAGTDSTGVTHNKGSTACVVVAMELTVAGTIRVIESDVNAIGGKSAEKRGSARINASESGGSGETEPSH